MKVTVALLYLSIISFTTYSFAEEGPINPGDNLDLTAVLNLFEKSKSVEDFENLLNSEKNDVNNLDLNDDGFVDYIRVIDYMDENTHSLTLQVPYSNTEAQDVAVILIEENDGETVLQIVGDEEIYGDEYILEPGNDDSEELVNVSNWAPVRQIYSPSYKVYVSPWKHNHYPNWYKPWKPVKWDVYQTYNRKHKVHCRRTHVYRSHHAQKHYRKHRKHSPAYHNHRNEIKKSPNRNRNGNGRNRHGGRRR
ncbi:MAG: hypothetical protein QNK23_16890 [Crocinitomicaceae bacterium]|nr:hypothetical protein [Crocinitomicaceae bacterium]